MTRLFWSWKIHEEFVMKSSKKKFRNSDFRAWTCLKWNPRFWDDYYNFIVQLRQKIKLNPSMGQKQYLKSCFRIRIFWKLCPVWGSDFFIYQNIVKNWHMFLTLSPWADSNKKSEPPAGHNFQNILILKHDFKYCFCPIEGFSLIFCLSWTIKL